MIEASFQLNAHEGGIFSREWKEPEKVSNLLRFGSCRPDHLERDVSRRYDSKSKALIKAPGRVRGIYLQFKPGSRRAARGLAFPNCARCDSSAPMLGEYGHVDDSPAIGLTIKEQAAGRLSAFGKQNQIFRPGIPLQIRLLLSTVLQFDQFLRRGGRNPATLQFSPSVLGEQPEQKPFVVGCRRA